MGLCNTFVDAELQGTEGTPLVLKCCVYQLAVSMYGLKSSKVSGSCDWERSEIVLHGHCDRRQLLRQLGCQE